METVALEDDASPSPPPYDPPREIRNDSAGQTGLLSTPIALHSSAQNNQQSHAPTIDTDAVDTTINISASPTRTPYILNTANGPPGTRERP